jgi:hypothetical protein
MPVVLLLPKCTLPHSSYALRISWQIGQGSALTHQPFWPPDVRRSPMAVYGSMSMMLYRHCMPWN